MAITFECPECRNQLSAKPEYAGKGGKCKCGSAVIVPGHPEKMKFACAQCGKPITISNRHAGKQGRCPLCKGAITVPRLGIPVKVNAPVAANEPPAASNIAPVARAAKVNVTCLMCKTSVLVPQSSAGHIIECAQCGSYMEVPGAETADEQAAGTTADSDSGQVKTDSPLGKIKCPSCERKLSADSPICAKCGIYIKSGRPILTSGGADPDELEEKAHGIIGALSWVIWSGIYPVYSDAIGNHKPYATWAITAVTVLISIWFSVLEYSGSPKMMAAKNLMLWSSNAEPDAESTQLLYDYTSYGDSEAFYEKRDELSGTVPEEELAVAALKALPEKQQCFGKFKFYQLITHAFLHAGPMHLAGNMLFLLVLGTRVNAAIGNIATLILYPILAIAAAVTHLLSIKAGGPPIPMLGASGAIMGMAGMYLLLFPIHKIYMVFWIRWGLLAGFHLTFRCFALRGFLVVLFYIMFDIIAVSLSMTTGTAHWAHIGGLAWGFLLALIMLTARLVYPGSDMMSLIFGKHAWRLIGTPANRLE